ncbi:Ankyrin repeat-containing domain superfamily [Arabidopsis thaliana x Arabidopsis arenosa]|uniref:Ankyrin repeat-containing domain superfamily n=1 Tax=Arabidopsis thaliana x Arabidopsis arenosa TaxID=1240361 RepID=A0A8T1ZIY9_9BRAS|nr:Ankyrin repeat-containing domain superfamily [Arabidopsis thaliana x Arabidopsis arenosa]
MELESMSFDFTEFCDSYSLYPTGKVSPVDSYVTDVDNEEIRDNYAFLDSVLKDNKSEFISHAKRILVGEDAESEKIEAIKLLTACCCYDSIHCASSIINGDVGSVPYINDVCSDTGLSPLHTAAEYNAPRCVEMLLKRRARTDMRSKDERALIPLELSLSNGSIDVTWNPSSDSIGDLIGLLGDKDLTVVKLLAEKTKEVDAVAYAYAKAGEIVSLTALLIVASEKIREATVALRDDDDSVPKRKRETIYEAVIQEALRSNSSTQSVCSEKRIVLLGEIELLQLFGAAVFSESVDKQTSPLISIVQAGDEAVLELFINTNLDVNEKDAEGNTVLQCSLKGSSVPHKQQTRIMSLLIAHGARVNQRNKLGLSAVHFAAANGNLSALEILLAANPELVNVKTVIKETPLFFAVKNNHLECVELLLRCGASTEIHNLRKQRPIELTQSQDIRFLLNPTNISCFSKETELAQSQSAAIPTNADDEETLGFLGNSVPPWLKFFVNWLPRYLRDTSASWRGAGYPLSSLKADFRAVFGMDLDHASLGFAKLIDFIKYFPKLCQMKVVPIGKVGAATHWVMLPTKSKCSQLKGRPPEPLIISKNDSVASPDKPKALSVPPGFKFMQEAHDFKTFKAPPEPKPQPPPPLTTASYNNQRQLKHPVLETLTRIRNSTSVFFLREFDFYQSYEKCLKEGMCFWCNKNMLLWANFPCRHKLWCSSCKQQVTQSALGEKSLEEDHHKCVVCDAKVERFVLSPPFESDHHRLSSDRPNNAELATSFLQFLSIRNSMNKMIHRGI